MFVFDVSYTVFKVVSKKAQSTDTETLMKANLTRREFIALSSSFAALPSLRFNQSNRVALVVDPNDSIASSTPVSWALSELEHSLRQWNIHVDRLEKLPPAPKQFTIVASGSRSNSTQALLKRPGVKVSNNPEALALVPIKPNALLACGSDARGLVYALLELTDRLNNAGDVTSENPFKITTPISEQPANAIRSVLRLFASDVEDKPWFNDRTFWTDYLSMLAHQRFNRFNLSLSLGYDFLRRVTDAYFLFPYPFLLSVPGYNVRVPRLPNAERDHNLEMLKFISEQTVNRGLDFQLGLWMHGYEWIDSPNANYTIEGLTKETHAVYCRDALRLLLQSCPLISGVTIRTHGESGVDEGSYQFWQTIFEGVASCGRRVEMDLHPKGLDETMLNNALATRQPVTVSPKFWAEHLGLPYHQADIRQLEVPDPKKQTSRLMNLSEGSRSFMRYGYGDLLREDRTWKVIHRVWPGSQRLLLWGDPVAAQAYSKAFKFCNSDGAEIMEPLTFKGRRGSGRAGNRCAYADSALVTHWDWQKYDYTYRVWGRLLYNPDAEPDTWRRYLVKRFGASAIDMETSLANASRILPLITTAHLPSAANNNYWPEMYLNHSLFDAAHPGSYNDSPAPKVFGNVSPLDPQLFYRINDYADDLLRGEITGKYSPLEVAQWLDDYIEKSQQALTRSIRTLHREPSAEFQRFTNDCLIQIGLGNFFAAKFRAAVLYRLFEKTGEQAALVSSLVQYRKARDHWAKFANIAKNVYVDDVRVGELPQLHGHWVDRLAAIEKDIEALDEKLGSTKPGPPSASVALLIKQVLSRTERADVVVHHKPPMRFVTGEPLAISLSGNKPVKWVKLYYRHVNQAERFNASEMKQSSSAYQAIIPADYTNSPYPLQYYFEIKPMAAAPTIYPGLSKTFTNQPYFLIRRS